MNSSESPFDTGPPLPVSTTFGRLKASARSTLSACILPFMKRTARAYVGGETIDDALIVMRRLAEANIPNTLGYWNLDSHTGAEVAERYLTAIERVTGSGLDTYISIKPPALRFSPALAVELAAAARARGVRLHCDSHGRDAAEPSCAFAQAMLEHLPPSDLGVTLPGRWSRSLSDADWAVERGLNIRVVKGQWPDPDDTRRDMRAGYLEVIDRLAGRARHVAVATHDPPLATEAIRRLRRAGTPCELELLLGVPVTPALRSASTDCAGLRIYIPFGPGYIPNAIGILRRNPRLAWRMIKDLATPTSKS